MDDPQAVEEPGTQTGARLDDPAVRALLAELNAQLEQLEAMTGPVGELALAAVAGLAEIYGQALARTLDLAGPVVVERMLGDELIGHLLALHGIHPEPVEARLDRVIEELRAALAAQGGTIEMVRLDDGVAVVRVSGGGHGSRSADVEPVVRRAVLTAVPELTGVTIMAAGRSGAAAFVPLDALLRSATSTRLP
jgi:Fe-S cluster biogenesis protein NfuA